MQKYKKNTDFFGLRTFEPLDLIGFSDLIVINNIKELRFALDRVKSNGQSLGFVPTMGALHAGHLELIAASLGACDITIASIYVNPTQFNNPDDLNKYPRDLKTDLLSLEQAQCDYVFLPEYEHIYPDGYQLPKVNLQGIDGVLEGEHRPGHFEGVIAVVDRFLELIRPNKAFFGEKDYQQFLVVTRMAKQRHSSVEVIPCPIVREANGLAMSSRNERLSSSDRDLAHCLVNSLQLVKENKSAFEISELESMAKQYLQQQKGVNLEYFKIVDEQTLLVPKSDGTDHLRGFVAAEIGGVRLIDNMKL